MFEEVDLVNNTNVVKERIEVTISRKKTDYEDRMTSIKTEIDFNFNDIDNLKSRIEYQKTNLKNRILNLKQKNYKFNNILENQVINNMQRCKLINWTIEVLYKFKQSEKTFFKVVQLIDLYLFNFKNLNANKLINTGILSILIASKMEEVNYISIQQASKIISKNKISVDELKREEIEFLNTINFNTNQFNYLDLFEELIEYLDLKNKLKNTHYKFFINATKILLKMVEFEIQIKEEYYIFEIVISIVIISLKLLNNMIDYYNINCLIKSLINDFNLDNKIILTLSKKIHEVSLNFTNNFPNLNNIKNFNLL